MDRLARADILIDGVEHPAAAIDARVVMLATTAVPSVDVHETVGTQARKQRVALAGDRIGELAKSRHVERCQRQDPPLHPRVERIESVARHVCPRGRSQRGVGL
jgi:hypothetical protein